MLFAISCFYRKLLKINNLIWEMVGVEPEISVENTQLTDSENASNSSNARITKPSVQITYKDFPELHNFQAPPALAQHAEVLCNIYTSIKRRWTSAYYYRLKRSPWNRPADLKWSNPAQDSMSVEEEQGC